MRAKSSLPLSLTLMFNDLLERRLPYFIHIAAAIGCVRKVDKFIESFVEPLEANADKVYVKSVFYFNMIHSWYIQLSSTQIKVL